MGMASIGSTGIKAEPLEPAEVTAALAEPVEIVDADVPYDSALVNLSMSNRVGIDGTVSASLAMSLRPYRTLKDGTVEIAPANYERTLSMESDSEDCTEKQQDVFRAIFDAIAGLGA
jgi:hypothetical protein